jgi:hypothetical protein
MQVNLDVSVVDLNGVPLNQNGKETSVANICVEVLLLMQRGDERTGEEKMQAFTLAEHIHHNKADVRLGAKDVTLLKGLVGKLFGPLIVGQIWRILDPDGKELNNEHK